MARAMTAKGLRYQEPSAACRLTEIVPVIAGAS
jgi:hypothetical protein